MFPLPSIQRRLYLLLFSWRIRARYIHVFDRPQIRHFFHWKWSGVCIPLFLGGGLTMASANHYTFAYVFFALSGIWSLGYWLTSDILLEMHKTISIRRIRRDPKLRLSATRKYWAWKSGVCFAITLTSAYLIGWTKNVKDRAEQDEVFQHLLLQVHPIPGQNAEDSNFSVTNNGATEIGYHELWCQINYAVYENGGVVIESEATIKASSARLRAGGDTQSAACLSPYSGFNVTGKGEVPLMCADVTFYINYVVGTQPREPRRKESRFVTHINPYGYRQMVYTWVGQPVDSTDSFCQHR